MLGVLPDIGISGTLEIAAPFNTLVKPSVRYTCVAVASIPVLISSGEDIFTDVYDAQGVDPATFNSHVDQSVRLVTFQSHTGELVRIPSAYILSLPDTSGVAYHLCALVINLSAIPQEMDLSSLKEDLNSLVEADTGVKCRIDEINYGTVAYVSAENHDLMQSARVLNMGGQGNLMVELRRLRSVNDSLTQKIVMLEQYIKNHR